MREGRHRAPRAAAGDELDRRVDQLHRLARLGSQAAVLDAVFCPICQGPSISLPRHHSGMACGAGGRSAPEDPTASCRPDGCSTRRARAPPRLRGSRGSLRASARRGRPSTSATNSSVPNRFVSIDRQARSSLTRSPLARADAVLPVVARDEVAARIPDDGDAELADEREDVATEPVLVRGRMTGLVDARVHATPEVLRERAEDAIVDARDSERRIDREPGPGHPLFALLAMRRS